MNLLIISFLSLWLGTQSTTALTVKINDINNPGKGKIYVLLWDQSDGFPKEVNQAKYIGTIDSFGSTGQYTFTDIPMGSYAISIYQDENLNKKIDTNFVGIPKEPIGAYGMKGLGRPNFNRSVLILDQQKQEVSIKMIND